MSVAPAELPATDYVFSAVSGNYTQQYYLQAFIGTVSAKLDFDSAEMDPSWVGSSFVTPADYAEAHPPPMEAPDPDTPDTSDASEPESDDVGRFRIRRAPRQIRKRMPPIDQAFLATAINSSIIMTEYVVQNLDPSGKTSAEDYLKKQLSWKVYGSTVKAYIDPAQVPLRVWVTEVKREDNVTKTKILWGATEGKPAALTKGEAPVLEAFVTQDLTDEQLEAQDGDDEAS